ncbi:PPOX class F420-dependent oxidoreductase [Micromonospora sp. NBC_00362]|uniref:PPOX class F420-dependent oxidoreductase n=1 Tax=unclassified Micromonospora TaxID=2617518 RepID=UPI0022528EC4|nr:PPOX class F420-dependent oxidoreductase [Micromonospora sp. NBC_00362]MCX5118847.1 PPOX class F420-dependent oxidoreductase [Micromonospora sp. NBC_00362]WTI09014.1 PPOX class F420-dependent oxidoreductase [Micromonospora sp. NBC_00821]
MSTNSDRLWELFGQRGRGVLVTVRRDGRPQLSNLDYLAEPGLIRCSTTGDRAKVRNLRRDPRASFHVTTPDGDAYAVAEGTVTLSEPAGATTDETVDELVEVYRRIRGDHPDWADYRAAMVADGRLVIRLDVHGVYGWRP